MTASRPPRIAPLAAALVAIASAAACADCSGDRVDPSPAGPARPAARWRPLPLASAPSLDALLRTIDAPSETLRLAGTPLDVYPELGRLIVYSSSGDVTVLVEQDGHVRASRLPALPITCRPEDVATDGRGNACALVRCVMTAACSSVGARGWTETPALHDADGLASAPGAIVAWRDAGHGALAARGQGASTPEPGKPGFELIASGDGARTWGRIALAESRVRVLAVLATTATDLTYVTDDGGTMVVQRGLPGSGGGGSFAAAPRATAQLTELVAANGLVGVATIRGHELDFAWASPEPDTARREHTIALGAAPTAVAAWDSHTLLVGVGRDLVGLELGGGVWGRSNGRIPEPAPVAGDAAPDTVRAPAPAIVGLGRVGSAIVTVLADGTALVFRGH